jgi:signal peptidase I
MTATMVEPADTTSERRDEERPGRLASAGRRVRRASGRVGWRRWAFRAIMAAFLGLILATYAVPFWFQLQGEQLLVVTSGSMEPEVGVGSAVVIHPIAGPSELRVGQVVTFYPPGESDLVTHRIVAFKELQRFVNNDDGGGGDPVTDSNGKPILDPYIQTKGDANEFPDVDLAAASQVRGIVRDVHPGWGYLLAWAHSGTGRFLLFVPPLLLLLGAEILSRVPERWSAARWNQTLGAIRRRDAAAAGPLARRDPGSSGDARN